MSRFAQGLVFVAALAGVVGATAIGQSTENPLAGDADAIAEGDALLDAVCGGYCHTRVEGETTDAPDLFDCEWWHGDTDADLFRVIRDGVSNTRMQAFGGQFPDEDIWRFVSAIRAGSRCAEEEAQGAEPPR